MSDKFEIIMQAFLTALQTISTATIERNQDVPEELNEGTLIILRDGQEMSSQTPLGFRMTSHEHQAEIVVLVAARDAAQRDSEYSQALASVHDALMVDPTLGGLIQSLQFERPDAVTDSNEGAAGVKAGVLEPLFYYDTDSYF